MVFPLKRIVEKEKVPAVNNLWIDAHEMDEKNMKKTFAYFIFFDTVVKKKKIFSTTYFYQRMLFSFASIRCKKHSE